MTKSRELKIFTEGQSSQPSEQSANGALTTQIFAPLPQRNIPLGFAAQKNGRPTLLTDQGDEVQLRFDYQVAAAAILICGALTGKNDYVEAWNEHHDDVLLRCLDGRQVLVQVKTIDDSASRWKCTSKPFVDAIGKFCGSEEVNGTVIRNYLFYSNVKAYVPGPSATKPNTLASSPVQLVDECCRRTDCQSVESPYREALLALSKACEKTPEQVFAVLRKLEFGKGPPLEGFMERLRDAIAEIPECSSMNLERLKKACEQVFLRFRAASAREVSATDLHATPTAPDGRPYGVTLAKRVSAQDVKELVTRHPGELFLYEPAEQLVHLGNFKASQKETLRAKMKAGGVEQYFTSIWLQGVAAESRLIEEALRNPTATLNKLNQLESVLIVECQDAEARAAFEPESRRGTVIYQRILDRTAELSENDSDYVVNERVQTLRGMAGLLSGSCKFAWGAPLPVASEK